jgi:hypothetical protein
MVRVEASLAESELPICKQMGKICLKNFDDVINSRAVFILLSLVESERTKDLVLKEVKAHKPTI